MYDLRKKIRQAKALREYKKLMAKKAAAKKKSLSKEDEEIEDLKADRKIMLEATKRNGKALLCYAS